MGVHDEFRAEARAWLEENCPAGARGPGEIFAGSTKVEVQPDTRLWLERMAERGWAAPTWPREYGGGGLGKTELQILQQEMRRIQARPPLAGRGLSYIGPTLLEYGSEEQKKRLLPAMARGEGYWCMGYSEPGAGSDLASLSTRAVADGDHFRVNGQKTWTSGGLIGDWMFLLVRTDPDVPKHDGISMILLAMDQPGVTVRPIRLISGDSPFCDTFFDDAIAEKRNLVGPLNGGWTVGKRLLQHERSTHAGLTGVMAARRQTQPSLADVGRRYVGEEGGRIADPLLRARIARHELNARAFGLTRTRALDASRDGNAPGATTSIFKYYTSFLTQEGSQLRNDLLGVQGLGWEGEGFSAEELDATRAWLSQRSATIAGGTREIQLNIIAKRVLGLPD